MTSEERKEFNEFLCGTSGCFNRNCWNKRDASDYLVYDNGMFRCHTHAYCARVTPARGKIVKCATRYYMGNQAGQVDAFKVSIVQRKIKALKDELTARPMKLVTQKGKTWIEIDGVKVSPRRFSQSWWTFNFEREKRE